MTHYASSPASFANSGSASDGSASNYGAKKSDEADKWAKIWFKQFCWFHRCSPNRGWQFSLDQVIQFLKSRVSKGEPAWKRLKVVEALIRFQKNLPEEQRTDLTFLRVKLRERAAFEKMQSNASGFGKNAGNESRAWLVFRAVSWFRLATFVDLDPVVNAANAANQWCSLRRS